MLILTQLVLSNLVAASRVLGFPHWFPLLEQVLASVIWGRRGLMIDSPTRCGMDKLFTIQEWLCCQRRKKGDLVRQTNTFEMKLWGKREEGLKKIFWWEKDTIFTISHARAMWETLWKKKNITVIFNVLRFCVCERGRETETEAEREKLNGIVPVNFTLCKWDYIIQNLK